MRSSILSALGGNLHAALAVLRSSVELFIYHYWWRNRLEEEKSFHAFYSWLNAEKASPPFKQILTDVYKKLDLPLEAYGKDDIYKGYKKLCSYVHKPTIQESVTRIRRSNSTIVSHDELYYWLNLLLQVQRPLLDLAIAHAPQALFPVAIYRKFGFNIPIGTLFDESNFIPVQEAIGPSKVLAYQEHYKRNRSVKELLHWVNNRTDLSDEEILNTWSDDPINDADLDFSERVFHRATMVKARMRALMVGFVYASMDAELFAVDMENDNERKFKKFKQRN